MVERPNAFRAGHHRLELGAHVMAARQVEAQRPPAPSAIVAVAGTKRVQAPLLLLAAELPRDHIFGDYRTAHERCLAKQDYRSVIIQRETPDRSLFAKARSNEGRESVVRPLPAKSEARRNAAASADEERQA